MLEKTYKKQVPVSQIMGKNLFTAMYFNKAGGSFCRNNQYTPAGYCGKLSEPRFSGLTGFSGQESCIQII